MNRKEHWQQVFNRKAERDVSWFEALPQMSLQMMEAAGLGRETCVLDVGGGDSRLVDALAERGLDCLAVLDVSRAALDRAQKRLGDLARACTWIESDVTAAWSFKPIDIWHDRAVFHFLTTAAERVQYRDHLLQTVKPMGAVIIATFALDGPERCSGLPVARYSAETLAVELGSEFRLVQALRHEHHTPWGAMQPFMYARLRREPGAGARPGWEGYGRTRDVCPDPGPSRRGASRALINVDLHLNGQRQECNRCSSLGVGSGP